VQIGGNTAIKGNTGYGEGVFHSGSQK
jgi:hypothetical protein